MCDIALRKSIRVNCGGVAIGGGAAVSVQSMTNTDTRDVKSTLEQIRALENAGCDIVRLAVPDDDAVKAFGKIRKETNMPLVADIHFDYKLALGAIEAGADKIRINPGNIGGEDKVREVVDAAKDRGIPIRIGVNSGSLEKDIKEREGGVTASGLVESALRNIDILDRFSFEDIVVSIKSSDVIMNTKAYRLVAKACNKPLHIGVTEAGTYNRGIIKSAVGLGALLMEGVGDTMRVSLTGDPVREVTAAKQILAAAGIYAEPIEIISCPTCGRTGVNLENIVQKVEAALIPVGKEIEDKGRSPLKVAVMGCEVNGPGEAESADIGVACGKGRGLLFAKGKPLETCEEEEIADRLVKLAKEHNCIER